MYKRIAAILFPIVALFFVGAAVWGYQENQEKNSILIKAENQYQRAFHDLTFHVNTMQDELSKAQVVASDGGTRKCLINIWRLSSQAASEINQLPLTLMPFHKTEEFLSKVSNFTYQVAVRDLSNEPLNDDEKKTLKTLKKQANDIAKELSSVREKVLSDHLRWMDVEMAIATEDKNMDNTIIDGFKTIDDNVGQFSETGQTPSMMDIADKTNKGNKLQGEKLDEAKVKQQVAKFLNLDNLENIKVLEGGKGLEYSFYSVQATRDGKEDTISLDVTQTGGHVIWMMNYRDIGPVKLAMKDAEKEALEFAKKHGLKNMVSVNIDQYDNVAVFTLAPRQGEVILYPDMVVVKVALDNGEVVGYQANGYVFNHRNRDLPKPELSKEEARGKVNGGLEIVAEDLVLVENENKKEILAYEFIGKLDGQLYRVFINALDGTEETVEILRMVDAERDKK
jgi:spore germination protein